VTTFGYSPKSADAVKDRLDRDLRSAEYYLDRIARAVPQAGAITGRLDEAKEIVGGVVDDLHDVIGERTEAAA
jgi:hypothetical protein